MIAFQPVLIATVASLALVACSFAPSQPKTSVPPPSPSAGLAEPGAGGGAAQGSETDAFGSVETTESGATQAAATEGGEEIMVKGPDGTIWVGAGMTDERRQTDVDSCYAYAQGQVAHDARIEGDVGMAFQSEAGGLGLAALRSRMSNYERTQRLPSLFNSCMVAKGYSRR